MPHWRALSQKTVTRRFAKLLANLHWTTVNVIAAIATNRNNNWRQVPAEGHVKSGCVIDPFIQLASDRLLPAFFDNPTLSVMLTPQRRGLSQGTKKIIAQAERLLKKAAANDRNELQAVCTKLPTLCTKLPTTKIKLVKCATEVARLHKVLIPSCTQNRPSPKVQSRSGDWI